jgi:hypothetical protein
MAQAAKPKPRPSEDCDFSHEEIASYIADVLESLRRLSDNCGLPGLSRTISLAHTEALSVKKQSAAHDGGSAGH